MYEKKFILKNWLTWLWRLARPKLAGWASRLETMEELMLQFLSEGYQLTGSLLLQRAHLVFCSDLQPVG